MKMSKMPLTKQLFILIMAWTFIFGVFVRGLPVILADFPINDGGLFYTLIEDLQKNRFVLPKFSSYNNASIPFNYPPLAFYLIAFLATVTQTDILVFIKWMPILVSTLSILAFYYLACEFTEDYLVASISTLSFAMIPTSAMWIIMGGGVTRSLGILFALLTMRFGLLLYRDGTWRNAILTTLFGSLLVLSHPEWTIQTVGTIVLFFLTQKNKVRNIGFSFAVATGILLVTMPWWWSILQNHGLAFFRPLNFGFHDLSHLLTPILLTFGHETYFPIITTIAIPGIAYLFLRKYRWWIFWFLIPFIVDPRIGNSTACIPLAISSGFGLILLLKLFASIYQPRLLDSSQTFVDEQQMQFLWKIKTTPFLFGYFMIYTLLGGMGNALFISNLALDQEVITSLKWIRLNISQNSNFLLITGEELFHNPIQEWFYPLTGSNSLTTYQGKEWTPDFYLELYRDIILQKCKFETYNCLTKWLEQYPLPFDYIYLYEGETHKSKASRSLGYSLQQEKILQLIYETEHVKIFKHILP